MNVHENENSVSRGGKDRIKKIIGVHVFWCCIFGYFTFLSNEPRSLKTLNEGDLIKNFPFFDETGETANSDVGRRFHFFFELNFYFSLTQLFLCLILLTTIHFNVRFRVISGLQTVTNTISDCCAITSAFLFFFAILWRFQPSGRLASGDGLAWDDSTT